MFNHGDALVVTARSIADQRGRVLEASDQTSISISGHSIADWGNNDPGPINNHSDVTWNLDLAPEQTRTLSAELSYDTS